MASWGCAGAFNAIVFGVGILELLHHASALGNVIVSDLRDSTVAVALASALKGVWSTGGDLLWGEIEELTGHKGSV